MTGPAIDLDKLAAIVKDPNKVKALPPTLVAKIHMDLAARDATMVAKPKTIIDETDPLVARQQMDQFGITDVQRKKGYQPRISEALYSHIEPSEYFGQEDAIKGAVKSILTGNVTDVPTSYRRQHTPDADTNRGFSGTNKVAEDAWRLYLGLPQKHSSLTVALEKPTRAKDVMNYFSVRDPMQILNLLSTKANHTPSSLEWLVRDIKQAESEGKKSTRGIDATTGIMGEYKLSQAIDKDTGLPYVAYHDIYDFDRAKGASLIGHPYEIYGRIYYDPKTFLPIPEEKVMWDKSKLNESHMQSLNAYIASLGVK